MAKEKNKPVAVRFDLKLMDTLKEEEKIETPQQALNFLANFWENNRPAKEGFAENLKEAAIAEPKLTEPKKKKETSSKAPGNSKTPPPGLSGIDLSIWKAEQKENK